MLHSNGKIFTATMRWSRLLRQEGKHTPKGDNLPDLRAAQNHRRKKNAFYFGHAFTFFNRFFIFQTFFYLKKRQ